MSVSVSRGVTRTPVIPAQKPAVYPLFPDVVLKSLPFYIRGDVLLRPSSLQPSTGGGGGKTSKLQEQTFMFQLSPSQARLVSGSKGRQQVQLRFSLLDTTSQQPDHFPKSLCVRVNGKLCSLPNPLPSQPNTEPRRPPGPLNVTSLARLTTTTASQQNSLTVSWVPVPGQAHTVSVYIVESLTHEDLLRQLQDKGVRNPVYTKTLIKEKLNDQDSEIATTSCKVSLACPLGKNRMRIPTRASTCDHLQCFDGQTYLMMNEKKPKWNCPVCNKLAEPISLQIDGFFQDLVKSPRLEEDEHEIVLHNDGTWDPLTTAQQQERQAKSNRKGPASASRGKKRVINDVDCITLEETSDALDLRAAPAPASKKLKPIQEIECIDID